jgi:UDP-glucuronate 4-epimerase
MQPGDVPATWADTAALRQWIGFAPATPLAAGIARFVDWYAVITTASDPLKEGSLT